MKVAQLQINPVLGKEEDNIKQISGLLNNCSDADIIVLPELANSGYNFLTKERAELFAVHHHHDNFISFLKEYSVKLNAAIISGYFEIDGDNYYNSSIFIDPKGNMCNYRKAHLFMNERNIFQPGNVGFPIMEYMGVKIGMLICFDYLFPEAWRILALKGADIIAHPSNLVTLNARKVVPAQAVINRIFIATTNRTGKDNGLVFNGNTTLYNPSGEIVASLNDHETGILFSDIDPEMTRNKMITDLNHVLNDRRPDIYSELL